jgi:hypothetical protein
MEFGNSHTWTKQGDIGEARAIYEYTKLGFGVSKTVFDSLKYDLIIDDGGLLQKVQVKTTSYKGQGGYYSVNLKTSGGNSSKNTIRNRQDGDYELLFVLSEDSTCWSIPITPNSPKTSIVLNKNYDKYKL